METIPDVVRNAVGIVFLVSFLGKARDIDGFLAHVVNYEVLPSRLAIVFGTVVIPAEALVALSLLTGVQANAGELIALILLGAFSFGVGMNLWRGRHVACGCFGARNSERISPRTLLRLALLAAGILLALTSGSAVPLLGDSFGGTTVRVSLVILVLVATSWILVIPEFVWLVTGRTRSR